jgi:phospholipid N-methyltransferase
MNSPDTPNYLQPYTQAARRFGGGFGSLLWASPKTQRARFEALARVVDFHGHSVLDLGCGRGDLLDFLLSRSIRPSRYVGIEAIQQLAAAARAKTSDHTMVLDGDFITTPSLMNRESQILVFSGSLNTLTDHQFHETLRAACLAATESVVFNFLSTPLLAGKPFLYWRHASDVLAFARSLSANVRSVCDYLEGDCTIAIGKAAEVA